MRENTYQNNAEYGHFLRSFSYKQWTEGGRFKWGSFMYRKYECGIKESNVSLSCS